MGISVNNKQDRQPHRKRPETNEKRQAPGHGQGNQQRQTREENQERSKRREPERY